MKQDRALARRILAAHIRADFYARVGAALAFFAAGLVLTAAEIVRTGIEGGFSSLPLAAGASAFGLLFVLACLEGIFTITQILGFILHPMATPSLFRLVPLAAVVTAVGLPIAQALESAPQGGWFWLIGGAAGLMCGAILFFLAPHLRGRHGAFLIAAAVTARFLCEPFLRTAVFLPASGITTLLLFFVFGMRDKLAGSHTGAAAATPPRVRWAAWGVGIVLTVLCPFLPDLPGDWIVPMSALLCLWFAVMDILLHKPAESPGRMIMAGSAAGLVFFAALAAVPWLAGAGSKAPVVRYGFFSAEGLTIQGALFHASGICGTLCVQQPPAEVAPDAGSFVIVTTDSASWQAAGWDNEASHNVFLPTAAPEFFPVLSSLAQHGFRTICAGRIPEGSAPGCQVLRRGDPQDAPVHLKKYREERTAVWVHAPEAGGPALRGLQDTLRQKETDRLAFVLWSAPAGSGRFFPEPSVAVTDAASYLTGGPPATKGTLDESRASHTWVRDWKRNRGAGAPLLTTSTSGGILITDQLTGAVWTIPWKHPQ